MEDRATKNQPIFNFETHRRAYVLCESLSQ
jgi:hypothetical protein